MAIAAILLKLYISYMCLRYENETKKKERWNLLFLKLTNKIENNSLLRANTQNLRESYLLKVFGIINISKQK